MDGSFVAVITVTGPAGGLLGRLARLVVTSLVVSGCGGWAHGELCGEDEFYDAVVDRCSLCRDVCDLCLWPESHSFCSRNCPEYYAKMQASKTGCPHTKQSPSPAVSAREYNEAENHPRRSSSTSSSSSSSSWSINPLMVTTIVALSIAVVATMVILPLVLCVQVRQRCTGKPAAGGTGARPQSAASPAAYDAVETGTMQPKLPSTPIYNPPNGLKEKSDQLLMSGVC